MPQKLENCVQHLMADPSFKPKNPKQDKKSAAYAVCTASLQKAIDDIQEAIVILKKFEDVDKDNSGEPANEIGGTDPSLNSSTDTTNITMNPQI